MKQNRHPLSDRQLRALLKGLREDVAAPADFRQGVMKRLQAEGLVAAPSVALRPSWSGRLSAWISPARLGLGLGAAAALALGLNFMTRHSATPPAVVVAAQPEQVQAPAQVQARVPRPAARPAALPVIELSAEPQSAPGPALGRSDAAVSPAAVQVSSEPVAKPTVIVVYPTATPLAKPLPGDSQVRNNVIRASRGEAALILFKVGEAGRVRVEIHDRLGRRVAVLRDAELSAGDHSVRWTGASDDGVMAASGIYQVRVVAPGYEARHKIMLAK